MPFVISQFWFMIPETSHCFYNYFQTFLYHATHTKWNPRYFCGHFQLCFLLTTFYVSSLFFLQPQSTLEQKTQQPSVLQAKDKTMSPFHRRPDFPTYSYKFSFQRPAARTRCTRYVPVVRPRVSTTSPSSVSCPAWPNVSAGRVFCGTSWPDVASNPRTVRAKRKRKRTTTMSQLWTTRQQCWRDIRGLTRAPLRCRSWKGTGTLRSKKRRFRG